MNRMAATVAAVALAAMATAKASVPLPVIEETGTPTLAPILKKVTPAVVSITVKGHAAPETAPQRRSARRAEPANDQQTHTAGSGVVFDARQGLILTNNHVIDKADDITVLLDDGRDLPAKLVGTDADTDVAIIKISADNLTAVPFGNSDQAQVGDFVLVIGNPFMIGRTVTAGIISGLHRNSVGIEQYEDFIQTDAAIYPGNSGGALVNLRGELVGISTAYIGASNTNPGMGFAIPVNMARIVINHLLESGSNRRGRLGITFEDATPALVREFKLAATPTTPLITKVDPGSSAERAGIKPGDVVTDVGGAPVRDIADLRNRLGLLWTGDVAELTVARDGKPVTIRATLADKELHAKPVRPR
jgi:S1-C subfamily serine protease